MKRSFTSLLITLTLACSAVTALAGDPDFGDFLGRVNLSAEADFGAFKARLSTDFATPLPQVEVLLKTLPTPADAYMCLKVAEVSRQPVEQVVTEFKKQQGKGWGVVAKNLGIKPGSSEFHALKAGKFDGGGGGGKSEKGHGKKK